MGPNLKPHDPKIGKLRRIFDQEIKYQNQQNRFLDRTTWTCRVFESCHLSITYRALTEPSRILDTDSILAAQLHSSTAAPHCILLISMGVKIV